MVIEGPPHVLFGTAHLITLAVIAAVCLLGPWALRSWLPERGVRGFAVFLAVSLVVHKLAEIWVKMAYLGLSLPQSLPLHLCGIAVFLTAYVLITRHAATYDLIYFWGLGGTVQALLTPDLPVGYPHPIYVNFFISHGAILFGISFATVIYGLRPTWASLKRAFIALNLLALSIGCVNWLAGTNYMFLCHKPRNTSSLLDYFGPWPWYILVLEGIALVLFTLVYLPWAVRDRWFSGRAEGAQP